LPPESDNAFNLSNRNGAETQLSNICETPKYSDFLHQTKGLQGYFDLRQGLGCARKLNKHVFLDFKGHTCSNCKVMDASVFSDVTVLDKIRKDFVIITLYVDDPTILPEKEWITSANDGKVKRTMGAINLDYEVSTFRTNTQPLYAILDADGKPENAPMEFNLDVKSFVRFLEDGVK
jgi:thiol:disulfide interchange protein DsbD